MAAVDAHRAILAVWRIEQPRLITSLARMLRDVPLAEELTQDALLAALERWPATGVPERPGAWLMAAARRRAVDHLRRRRMLERKHAMVARDLEAEQQAMPDLDSALDDDIGDELLRLIFTACHPRLTREGRAALAGQARVAGGEDQPQQLVADVIVQGGVEIGHGLLLGFQVAGDHRVLAFEHAAAAQMVDGPAPGRRHQPGAGSFRHARGRPPLQGGQQGVLGQLLGQGHVAQHPRQAGDQAGLFDAPDRQDRAMGVYGCHERRRGRRSAGLKGRRTRGPRTCLPSRGGSPCAAA